MWVNTQNFNEASKLEAIFTESSYGTQLHNKKLLLHLFKVAWICCYWTNLPQLFAMVKVDQYTNIQSLSSIVDVFNWFCNQNTAGGAIIAPSPMRIRVNGCNVGYNDLIYWNTINLFIDTIFLSSFGMHFIMVSWDSDIGSPIFTHFSYLVIGTFYNWL